MENAKYPSNNYSPEELALHVKVGYLLGRVRDTITFLITDIESRQIERSFFSFDIEDCNHDQRQLARLCETRIKELEERYL